MRLAFIAILSLLVVGCATHPSDTETEKLAAASNQARKTGVCNIHHVRMHKLQVRLEYAHLPVDYFSSAYYYAQLQSFPHAREYALSLDPKDDGKKFQVFVCPQCKAALREWMAKHPNDEWGKLMGPKKV
ncbi:MAG TPA: hypothetical protein VIU85_00480 [Chthoniobacterales bacterium]